MTDLKFLRDKGIIKDILKCSFGEEKVIYISGPITTGKIWLNYISLGIYDLNKQKVINENSQNIIVAADKVRNRFNRNVIEPASLYIHDWGQENYIDLWLDVIESYAEEVWFVPGWNYSVGAILEFKHTLKNNILTKDIDGNILDISKGKKELEESILYINKINIQDEKIDFLKSVIIDTLYELSADM